MIVASFFGDQISSGVGSFFAFVMILIIVIRIKKLKPVEGLKKLKSSRVAKRTKTIIDAEIVDLNERIIFYSTYKEQPVDASPDSGIVLQADEHAIAIASEVGLIESRSSGGVAEPTLVDEGRFLVTDQRGVFIGNN